jgi:hypothetical protein
MIDIKGQPVFVRSTFSMENLCLDYDQETSMHRSITKCQYISTDFPFNYAEYDYEFKETRKETTAYSGPSGTFLTVTGTQWTETKTEKTEHQDILPSRIASSFFFRPFRGIA